jgi:hypothetical protein
MKKNHKLESVEQGVSIWGCPQGRNYNICVFAGPPKGLKKE